jgi:hypothetical protein
VVTLQFAYPAPEYGVVLDNLQKDKELSAHFIIVLLNTWTFLALQVVKFIFFSKLNPKLHVTNPGLNAEMAKEATTT